LFYLGDMTAPQTVYKCATFAEAVDLLRQRAKADRSLSVGSLCAKAGISRNVLYVALKPGSTAMGPQAARRLAEEAGLSEDECDWVAILWLKNRYHPDSGATGGVVKPLFDLVDSLSRAKQLKVYGLCVAGYLAAKIDTPKRSKGS